MPDPDERGEAVDLQQCQVPQDILELVPKDVAKNFRAIPLKIDGDRLVVATDRPSYDVVALDDLSIVTGRKVEFMHFSSSDIDLALARFYGE